MSLIDLGEEPKPGWLASLHNDTCISAAEQCEQPEPPNVAGGHTVQAMAAVSRKE